MTCPICQHNNREEARFCEACGASLSTAARDRSADLRRQMPRSLTDKILVARGELAGERKPVTVVFADISGFTAMSERMDAEEVRNLVNRCFEALVEVIHRYEGVVDKFIGDEIMALFGAPVAHENDPERAVRASLEMLEALEGIAADLPHRVGMHVGINAGEVIAGGVGTDLRMDYTVMGDTVNLAKRLESAARSGQILVSQAVYRATERAIEYHRLRPIRVKGKSERIPVYEALGVKAHPARVRGLTPGRAPLVGRGREVAQAQQVADALSRGEGGVLCITGDAGIGKSRLKYELTGMLSDRGISFVEGACTSYEVPSPYQVVGQVCRELLGIEEEESSEQIREKLAGAVGAALAPYLGSVIGVRYEEVLLVEDAVRQGRACEAVVALIRSRTAGGPLTVVFEDFHWRDDLSQGVVDHLVDRVGELPLLICCLYRPEFRHAWSGRPSYREIALSPLTAEDSLELAESLLAIRLPDEIRGVVLQKAEGNPFYIEEVLRMFIDEGVIARTRRGYEVRGDIAQVRVPETIQGLIVSRIDRLEEQAKQTLQRASVIGRNFPRRLLEAISEDREGVDAHLARLQEAELVYRYEILPELEYIFKHLLTQEVAYNSLLLQRRKEIHLQIGQAIEQLYQDRLEEYYEVLAYHYSNGEAWEKAFLYYNRAGNRTREMHSDATSLQFYERGREALGRLFQSREEVSRFQFMVRWVLIPLSLLSPFLVLIIFLQIHLGVIPTPPGKRFPFVVMMSIELGLPLVLLSILAYRFVYAARTVRYLSVYPDRFQVITKKGIEDVPFFEIKGISAVNVMQFLLRGMFTRSTVVGGGIKLWHLLRRTWWILVERQEKGSLLIYSGNAEALVQEVRHAALRWVQGQGHVSIPFDTKAIRREERKVAWDVKEAATDVIHRRMSYSEIVAQVRQRKIQPADLISRSEDLQDERWKRWETAEQFSKRHPSLQWSFRPVRHGLARGVTSGFKGGFVIGLLFFALWPFILPINVNLRVWHRITMMYIVSWASAILGGMWMVGILLGLFISLLTGTIGVGIGVLVKTYSTIRVGLTNPKRLRRYEKWTLLPIMLAAYPICIYFTFVVKYYFVLIATAVFISGTGGWIIAYSTVRIGLTDWKRLKLGGICVLLSMIILWPISIYYSVSDTSNLTAEIWLKFWPFVLELFFILGLFSGGAWTIGSGLSLFIQAVRKGISTFKALLRDSGTVSWEGKTFLVASCAAVVILIVFSFHPMLRVHYYLFKGGVYEHFGRAQAALQAYDQAILLRPGNVLGYKNKASLLYKLNRDDEAIAELKRVLVLDPDDARAYNGIAWHYAERGVHLDEALSLIDRALALAPNNANFLDTKAWVLYKMGNYIEAKKYIDMALKKRPKRKAFLERSEAIAKALQGQVRE